MSRIDIKKIFNSKVEFLYGAPTYKKTIECHLPEIAFIGASNCGKSSLINAIFKQKIANTSSQPGRTQHLNFFKNSEFREGFLIVDMPGYGFARAPQAEIQKWQKTCDDYFSNRPNLVRVFLLIDAVKSIKANDFAMMQTLEIKNLNFSIILTKIDKITIEAQKRAFEICQNQTSRFHNFCLPPILVSSKMSYGIFDAQNEMISAITKF